MSRIRWSWAIGCPLACVTPVVALWLLVSMPWISRRDEPSEAPVSQLSVTRSFGRVQEIFVKLGSQTRLLTALDMSLFGGLPLGSTPEAAAEHFKVAPSGRTDGDVWFRTTLAEVHLWYSPSETGGGGKWLIYARPTRPSLSEVFTNSVLRSQLQPFLPKTRLVSITVHGGDGAIVSIDASQAGVETVYLWKTPPGSA